MQRDYSLRWVRGLAAIGLAVLFSLASLTPLAASVSSAAACCRSKSECCCHRSTARGGRAVSNRGCPAGCGHVTLGGNESAQWAQAANGDGAPVLVAGHASLVVESSDCSRVLSYSLWQRPPPSFFFA